MEADGFKKRIEVALFNEEFIKIIFQYPDKPRAVVKRGRVIDVSENAFELNEIRDGKVVYSYRYIVEIMEAKNDELIGWGDGNET